MLVLSRKTDESIAIGDDIVVRVLEVDRNGNVRLGIDAPRSCRILRGELMDEIRGANTAALAESGFQLPDLGFTTPDTDQSAD